MKPKSKYVGRSVEVQASGSEFLALEMPDGSTITVPWRQREVIEGPIGQERRRLVRWPDFCALADPETGIYLRCERCEGHPEIGGGDPNHGAPRGGVLSVMVKRHPERREEQPRIIQVACACDCVYGAWVHRCDQLPFASHFGVPPPPDAPQVVQGGIDVKTYSSRAAERPRIAL